MKIIKYMNFVLVLSFKEELNPLCLSFSFLYNGIKINPVWKLETRKGFWPNSILRCYGKLKLTESFDMNWEKETFCFHQVIQNKTFMYCKVFLILPENLAEGCTEQKVQRALLSQAKKRWGRLGGMGENRKSQELFFREKGRIVSVLHADSLFDKGRFYRAGDGKYQGGCSKTQCGFL